MASVAELKKSFFAEIDKVENREDLEKLRVKYLGREKGILTAVLRSLGGMPLAKRKEFGPRRLPAAGGLRMTDHTAGPFLRQGMLRPALQH